MRRSNASEREIAIKKALLDAGIRQVNIANDLGVKKPCITMYIQGKSKSKRFNEWVKKNLLIDLDSFNDGEVKNG